MNDLVSLILIVVLTAGCFLGAWFSDSLNKGYRSSWTAQNRVRLYALSAVGFAAVIMISLSMAGCVD